jgi:hypothetical protein
LFLPHQAALEFHNNRIGVIEGIKDSYSNLLNILEGNFKQNLEGQINHFKKHPSIIIDNIFKLHTEFLKKVSDELDKQKKNHPDFKSKDDILTEITLLFDKRIGKEFTKDDLKKIYIEGKDRYDEQIPPGFKDYENKKKKDDRHIYGDLIIWKELMNFSKKEKKPLIFVTDDRKEDWWTIENGKTIRPREELIKEFYDITDIRILIYNADIFLHYAKEKRLVPEIKENTIQEIKEIRISDEKNYANIRESLSRLNSITRAVNEVKNLNLINNSQSIDRLLTREWDEQRNTLRGLINTDLYSGPTSIRELLKNEFNSTQTFRELSDSDSFGSVIPTRKYQKRIKNEKDLENKEHNEDKNDKK